MADARFSSVAERAQRLDGFQQTLEPISSTGRYKVMQNAADGNVYASVNGGAWVNIIGPFGIIASLDSAYDNGGAGLGRTINVDSGAVALVNSQTTGTILSITSPATAVGVGGLIGLSIDMSGATGANYINAINIIGAPNVKAKTFQQAAIVLQGRSSLASAFATTVRNVSALVGSLWYLGWDTTSTLGGAGVATILTGQTHMVTLDSGDVATLTPGAQELVNLRIRLGDSSHVDSSAIRVDSTQTGALASASVVNVTGAATSRAATFTSGAANLGVTVAINHNGTTVAAPNSSQVALAIGGDVHSCAFDVYPGDAVPVGPLTAARIKYWAGDLWVSFGGAAYTKFDVSTPDTLGSSYIAGASIVISAINRPVAITNTTPFASSLLTLTQDATTITAPLTVAGGTGSAATFSSVAGSTLQSVIVTHNGTVASTTSVALRLEGNAASCGLEMADGANLGLSPLTSGRIRFVTATPVFEVSLNGGAYSPVITVATNSLQVAYNGGASIAVTPTNPVTIYTLIASGTLYLQDSATATNANIGLEWARLVGPLVGSTWSGRGALFSNLPNNAVAYTESGVVVAIVHQPIGTVTDTTKGLTITMTPASSAAVVGQTITMGANTSNAGSAANFLWGALAGHGASNAIVNVKLAVAGVSTNVTHFVEIGSSVANYTLGNDMTAINVDFVNNFIPGAFACNGATFQIPATTFPGGKGYGAIVLNSAATLQRVVDLNFMNGTGVVFSAHTLTNLTLVGQLSVFELDMRTSATNITAGLTNIIEGFVIYMPATSNVSSRCFSADSTQTAGAGFYATMTGVGAVTGAMFDMAPTAPAACIGQATTIGTNATSSGSAANFIWNSSNGTNGITNNAIVNIYTNAVLPGSGVLTFLSIGVRAAMTPVVGPVTGVLVDLTTNVAANVIPVVGAKLVINASSSSSTRGIIVTSAQMAGVGLDVVLSPAAPALVYGAFVTADANVTGTGMTIKHLGTVPSLTCVALDIYGDAAATGIQLGDGATLNVSDATNCRLRFLTATPALQVSLNGGAFSTIITAATLPANSLQAAYTGGQTINATLGAVAISSAAADNVGLLTLVKNPAGAQSGTILAITGSPGAAGAMIGQSITMGANASGAALSIAHSGTGANLNFTISDGGTGHILGPTTGPLNIFAGSPGGSANGRGVQITGSNASTSGVGGPVTLTAGAGASAGNGGDIVFNPGALAGAGRQGYCYVGGAFAKTKATVTFNLAGTSTVNCGNGNYFTVTATGATTWAFSKPMDTGYVSSFVLELTNGGLGVQTWTTAGTGGTPVKWPGGTAPVLVAAGVDLLVFTTIDGGVTWRGVLSEADSK